MTPVQIIGLVGLALAARAWLAGCDFFLGPEDRWNEPTPFEVWKEKRS